MIRNARIGDEYAIYALICELAIFEKAPDAVVNTPENLKNDLFDDPVCEALVVEIDGEVVGFALFYTSYSTWKGRCLYLEDFYVQPAYRNQNLGKQLFETVVELAKSRGVKRMDWQVLDWNQGAIRFYERQGALLDPEWINGRLFF